MPDDVDRWQNLLQKSAVTDWGLLGRSFKSRGFDALALTPFYAALALRDVQNLSGWRSCARHCEPPCGPRSGSRPSLRMRFRCANRISTFLRSCRDSSLPSVPEECRSPVSPGPLRRRIGWRDKLRDLVGGHPEAVSSTVGRHSFTARLAISGPRSLRQF